MDDPGTSHERPQVWLAVLVGVALLATAFWALETGHAWVNILLAVGVVAARMVAGARRRRTPDRQAGQQGTDPHDDPEVRPAG